MFELYEDAFLSLFWFQYFKNKRSVISKSNYLVLARCSYLGTPLVLVLK